MTFTLFLREKERNTQLRVVTQSEHVVSFGAHSQAYIYHKGQLK